MLFIGDKMIDKLQDALLDSMYDKFPSDEVGPSAALTDDLLDALTDDLSDPLTTD